MNYLALYNTLHNFPVENVTLTEWFKIHGCEWHWGTLQMHMCLIWIYFVWAREE